MVFTLLKQKALDSIFGPLQEVVKQKSRIVYATITITFILAFVAFVLALVNQFQRVEPAYWYDPNVVTIDHKPYVTVYAR